MTAEQFKEVEDLFFRLQPLSADERRAALATVDPVVREETEKLLGVSIQDTDPLTQFGSHVSKMLPAAADARPTTLVGEVVGPYRVLSLIGQGGMGVVYLAEDIRLGRRAALKAILPDAQQTTTRLDRFRREARVLANLSDVNIATVYGLEESHGTLLLAMEYIQGQTLAQRLQRGAKLQLHEALSICDQVAAGIQCAHDAGIIHRDLKPANVMITNEGVVKVLDFGLARDIADRGSVAPASENLTREGSIFGTPAYMSPEQARGDNLDRRSDIFSFGVLLFRCLAGRLPFDGETDAELADAILHHEPEWSRLPAGTPEPIRRLLKRAMAKNPAHRYHHIADARLEIREAQTAPAPEPAAKPRRRWIAALPWAACLLLAGGLVGMWANRTPEAVPVGLI